jgi:hypothetical protein
VDVNLVNVDFSVRDVHGRLAGDLSKDDFEVFGDGVPQCISFFTAAPPTFPTATPAANDAPRDAHARR